MDREVRMKVVVSFLLSTRSAIFFLASHYSFFQLLFEKRLTLKLGLESGFACLSCDGHVIVLPRIDDSWLHREMSHKPFSPFFKGRWFR